MLTDHSRRTADRHILSENTPCISECTAMVFFLDVTRLFTISYSIAHCMTTSDPDYGQLKQRYTTRYMDLPHNCNEQPPGSNNNISHDEKRQDCPKSGGPRNVKVKGNQCSQKSPFTKHVPKALYRIHES